MPYETQQRHPQAKLNNKDYINTDRPRPNIESRNSRPAPLTIGLGFTWAN